MAFITHWYDIVNALFELAGGIFVWLNVAAIRRDKGLKGIRWEPQLVFTIWGFWNIFYYQHLGQIWSAVASVSVVLANGAWLWFVWKYWVAWKQYPSTYKLLYGGKMNHWQKEILEFLMKYKGRVIIGERGRMHRSTTPASHPWRSGTTTGRIIVRTKEPQKADPEHMKNFIFATGHVDAILPEYQGDRRFHVGGTLEIDEEGRRRLRALAKALVWWRMDLFHEVEASLRRIRERFDKTHGITVIHDEVVTTLAPAGDLPAIAQTAYPVEICEHACDIRFCYICRSGSV